MPDTGKQMMSPVDRTVDSMAKGESSDQPVFQNLLGIQVIKSPDQVVEPAHEWAATGIVFDSGLDLADQALD